VQVRAPTYEAAVDLVNNSPYGNGVAVSNPHTFILDSAGWKRVDAPQAEFKRIADPHGLMNPGKLKEWKAQQLRAIAS